MTTTKLTEMNSTGDDSYNNIVGRVEYFGMLNDLEVIVQEMDLLQAL